MHICSLTTVVSLYSHSCTLIIPQGVGPNQRHSNYARYPPWVYLDHIELLSRALWHWEKKAKAEKATCALKQTKSATTYTHKFNLHLHSTTWEVLTPVSSYTQGSKKERKGSPPTVMSSTASILNSDAWSRGYLRQRPQGKSTERDQSGPIFSPDQSLMIQLRRIPLLMLPPILQPNATEFTSNPRGITQATPIPQGPDRIGSSRSNIASSFLKSSERVSMWSFWCVLICPDRWYTVDDNLLPVVNIPLICFLQTEVPLRFI